MFFNSDLSVLLRPDSWYNSGMLTAPQEKTASTQPENHIVVIIPHRQREYMRLRGIEIDAPDMDTIVRAILAEQLKNLEPVIADATTLGKPNGRRTKIRLNSIQAHKIRAIADKHNIPGNSSGLSR